ncbi:MAG: DUF4214 domain-containing protein [Acidobacteriota bacterium]|nr:DUF4214 domain-containing protein [Acidobacteriota bacterium]
MKAKTSHPISSIFKLARPNARTLLAAGLLLACLLLLSPAAFADGGSSTGTKIEAALSGAAIGGLTPKGEAEFEQKSDGSRKLEVEVEHVNLPSGTVLDVLVDGQKVGSLTLDSLMAGKLELETEHGQTFPLVNSRTRVVVADANGNTIVAGSFGDITPTPTPTPGASPTPTPGASPTPMPSPSPTPTSEVRIESLLAGGAIGGLTPKGHAKFRSRNGESEFEVEVEKVNLPAGTALNVLVDGLKVGELRLAATLEGELELESEHGANVPAVTSASTVVVTNAGGQTILSGAFNSGSTAETEKENDIDDSNFFVEQQYHDFLDREPDDSGLDFWKAEIERCGGDDACAQRARVNTSGAFFLSIEFQETGYMLYRFQKETTGKMPRRNDFLVWMQQAAQGLVVGQTGWEQKLEDNKRRVADDWVNRPDFHARFDQMTDDQFVDALFANAGVRPAEAERNDLVEGLRQGRETRATVLRKVSDDAEFKRKEQNPAFVLMQYFGYLHRNPDEGADTDMSGFNFWLRKLDDNGGDFHKAEMVRAFIESGEYRNRFDW